MHVGPRDPATTSATNGVAEGNTGGHALVRRGTVATRMAIDVSVVRELSALRAIEGEWRALASTGAGALFRGPDWLLPWWHAYHNTLAAELHVLVGRAVEGDPTTPAGEIVCIAPFYRRTVKVAL